MTVRRLTVALSGSIAAFAIGALTLAAPASAHDELVASNPSAGAALASSPAQVVLRFEEPPVAGFTSVEVKDAAGHIVSVGSPNSAGSVIRERVKPSLPVGNYTIAYRVLSDDGHVVAQSVPFTVGARAIAKTTTSSAAPAVAATPHSSTSASTWGIAFGALAVVAVALGAAGTTRRRRVR